MIRQQNLPLLPAHLAFWRYKTRNFERRVIIAGVRRFVMIPPAKLQLRQYPFVREKQKYYVA